MLFPHEKKVAMALDKVHPVPCVFLVLCLELIKILKSFLFKKISMTFFDLAASSFTIWDRGCAARPTPLACACALAAGTALAGCRCAWLRRAVAPSCVGAFQSRESGCRRRTEDPSICCQQHQRSIGPSHAARPHTAAMFPNRRQPSRRRDGPSRMHRWVRWRAWPAAASACRGWSGATRRRRVCRRERSGSGGPRGAS